MLVHRRLVLMHTELHTRFHRLQFTTKHSMISVAEPEVETQLAFTLQSAIHGGSVGPSLHIRRDIRAIPSFPSCPFWPRAHDPFLPLNLGSALTCVAAPRICRQLRATALHLGFLFLRGSMARTGTRPRLRCTFVLSGSTILASTARMLVMSFLAPFSPWMSQEEAAMERYEALMGLAFFSAYCGLLRAAPTLIALY